MFRPFRVALFLLAAGETGAKMPPFFDPENGFLDRMADSKRSEERLPKAAQRESVVNQLKGFTGIP